MTKRLKLRLTLFLAALLILIAAVAPYITPHDPTQQNLALALAPPNADYLLGTDRYGRCVFSRVLYGAQLSVFSALTLIAITSTSGTLIGLLCGYIGGKTDSAVMRLADVFLSFPGLVFAIAVASVFGGGIINAVLALAVISWPKYALLVRAQTLNVKNSDYVAAARFAGRNKRQIIFSQILPSVLPAVTVMATLDIGVMLIELAGLSFLGLGAQSPAAEWGFMMSSGRSMLQTAPWTIFAPGCALFLTVSIFNLLGDSLRDYLDPNENNQE